jgi:hypothetical protein
MPSVAAPSLSLEAVLTAAAGNQQPSSSSSWSAAPPGSAGAAAPRAVTAPSPPLAAAAAAAAATAASEADAQAWLQRCAVLQEKLAGEMNSPLDVILLCHLTLNL